MDFTKLTFPPQDHRRLSDSEQGKHAAESFAGKYDAAVARCFATEGRGFGSDKRELFLGQPYKSHEEAASKACEHINAFFKKTRHTIVQEMQEYLLQHNGVVDFWPDPSCKIIFHYFEVPGVTFQFDFFGAEFVSDRKGNVKRSSSKPVFYNDYHFSDTEDYRKIKEKEGLMEKRVKEGKLKGDRIPRFFAFLGFLYCIYAVLAVVGDVFFDFGNWILSIAPQSPVEESIQSLLSNVGWLLMALPVYICQFLESVCGDISGVLVIIAIVILIGACLLGAFCCQKYLAFYRRDKKQYNKAKKELQKLRSSQEYSRVIQENAALKKEYEAMADQWLKAWYAWVCRTSEK